MWKLDTRRTLTRLVDSKIGIPEAVLIPDVLKSHIRWHVKYTNRVTKFWADCLAHHQAVQESELRVLQNNFNVTPTNDWAERGGVFINSSNSKKVTTFFSDNPDREKDDSKKHSTDHQTFRKHGKGWREVLVLPYQDVPGRVCGFLLIGRGGDQHAGDWIYKPTLQDRSTTESGLWMLETLLAGPHPSFGNTGVIVTNPEIVLALQMRHLREYRRPLPMAATWTDADVDTSELPWLSHDDLIFWGGDDPITPIAHARRRHARVSLFALSEKLGLLHLNQRSPSEWMQTMKETAVPWQVALEQQLQAMDSGQIEGTLGRIGLNGDQLTQFIAGCRPELRSRLEHVEKHSVYAKRVQFNSRWVYEKEDSWRTEKGDELISNAIVRVDHVLTTKRGETSRSYYRGVIRFNGQQYPFTEMTATLDRGMLAWAQGFLRDNVCAGMMEFHPAWNRRSLNLAITFHKPKMVSGVEAIGWDNEHLQFNFPHFSILRDGGLTDEFACLFDHDRTPGRNVPQPGAIPTKHIKALSEENDETLVFWGVAAHVITTIVCPAINRIPTGLILDGPGAKSVGAATATHMGVISGKVQYHEPDPLLGLRQCLGKHGYPVIVESDHPSSWLELPETRRMIVMLDWATNRVLAARGKWNLIRMDRKLGSMQLLSQAAAAVLPNYLQDLYRRGLILSDSHNDLILNVLADVADWFRRTGGNPDVVLRAKSIMELPGLVAPWQHFLQLVYQLHADGRLTFNRADFDSLKKPKSDLVEVTQDGRTLMWVSQDRFSDAVKQVGSLPPDLLVITESLKSEGILLAEPDYREDRGWLVDGKWWQDQLSLWRSK